MTQHTSKGFENELLELRERILEMGGLAEIRIAEAMRALVERDDELALRIVRADDEIDQDELEIDALAQTILATRQPVASDLRFITMAMKIVTDLERIGDLAANIAKRAHELNRLPVIHPPVDFAPLAVRVQHSLRDALDSFVRRDPDKATSVIVSDREIDRLNADLFATLIQRVAEEPANASRVIPLTSIARSLERIGDHAKNLAEEVMFMVRGKDVRHGGLFAKGVGVSARTGRKR
jgi:phosphate transport system protein